MERVSLREWGKEGLPWRRLCLSLVQGWNWDAEGQGRGPARTRQEVLVLRLSSLPRPAGLTHLLPRADPPSAWMSRAGPLIFSPSTPCPLCRPSRSLLAWRRSSVPFSLCSSASSVPAQVSLCQQPRASRGQRRESTHRLSSLRALFQMHSCL